MSAPWGWHLAFAGDLSSSPPPSQAEPRVRPASASPTSSVQGARASFFPASHAPKSWPAQSTAARPSPAVQTQPVKAASPAPSPRGLSQTPRPGLLASAASGSPSSPAGPVIPSARGHTGPGMPRTSASSAAAVRSLPGGSVPLRAESKVIAHLIIIEDSVSSYFSVAVYLLPRGLRIPLCSPPLGAERIAA